jgi:hypothetical protein
MLARIKELLQGKGISEERIEQAYHLIKSSGRYPARMPSHYLAIAIQLIDRHLKNPASGVEIYIGPEPTNHALGRPSVTFAVLALDWPGLLNSCAGTLHEKGFNVAFLEAIVIKEPNSQLGIILMDIDVERRQDHEKLLALEDEIEQTLRMAAARDTGKDELLHAEARKSEHYSRVLEHLKKIATDSEHADLFEKQGEAVRFFGGRSLAYLTERSPEDLANQIHTNYLFTKMVRENGKIYAKVGDTMTPGGQLTGISVAGYEHDFTMGDAFRIIDELVPGYQRKYDKAYITSDGINVFRIEIVDAAGQPLAHDRQVELAQRLSGIKDSPECSRLSPGVEMIGRKICPAMLEEERHLMQPQVYMHPHSRSNIKVVIVTSGVDRGHTFNAIQEISKVRGLQAAMPDAVFHVTHGEGAHSAVQEVAIVDVWVDFTSFFGTSRGPYDDELILVAIEDALRSTEFMGPKLRIFDRTGRQMRRSRADRIVTMAEKAGLDSEITRQILSRLGDRQIISPTVTDKEVFDQVQTGVEAVKNWTDGGRSTPGMAWRTTDLSGHGGRTSYTVFGVAYGPERSLLPEITGLAASAGSQSSAVVNGKGFTLVLFRLAHRGKALDEKDINQLALRLATLLTDQA